MPLIRLAGAGFRPPKLHWSRAIVVSESIEVSETAVGRMLGYGTIVMIETGETLEPSTRWPTRCNYWSEVQQQIEMLH